MTTTDDPKATACALGPIPDPAECGNGEISEVKPQAAGKSLIASVRCLFTRRIASAVCSEGALWHCSPVLDNDRYTTAHCCCTVPSVTTCSLLAEVEQYGSDSYGDPGYVKIYGERPAQWYGRGIRLLGRTAVEHPKPPSDIDS